MTIYLDEDCVGDDALEIIFPNLIICMGMAAQMQDGTLVGAHISSTTTEDFVLAELKSRIESVDSTVVRYYMIANFNSHFDSSRKYLFGDKARAVGCDQGLIKVVNTTDITETSRAEGYFVRLLSGGHDGACSIFVHDQSEIELSGFAMGQDILDTCTVKKATSDGAKTPGAIFSADNADRPGTPIDETYFKTVCVH